MSKRTWDRSLIHPHYTFNLLQPWLSIRSARDRPISKNQSTKRCQYAILSSKHMRFWIYMHQTSKIHFPKLQGMIFNGRELQTRKLMLVCALTCQNYTCQHSVIHNFRYVHQRQLKYRTWMYIYTISIIYKPQG
jgi:hypothetical protein